MGFQSQFIKWKNKLYDFGRTVNERSKNNKLKRATLNSLPFWIASVAAGLLAVFYSEIFHLAETLLNDIDLRHNPWVFVFTPLAFVISWFLIYRFSKSASGSGIPQLMVAIDFANQKKHKNIINRLLSVRVIIVKILRVSGVLQKT